MTEAVLWKNLNLLTTQPQLGAGPLGIVSSGALLIREQRILGVGTYEELLAYARAQALEIVERDGQGYWAMPAWIDPHTHLVFGGHRLNDYEDRRLGISYAEIAQRGGGILSTVRETRLASERELYDQALYRALKLLDEGVHGLEIKSGYGLTLESEAKMLRVIRRLSETLNIPIQSTFLGAHALPPEFKDKKDAYVMEVVDHMMPVLATQGLIDAVDVFCDIVGFDLEQSRLILERARDLGLKTKMHAEQLAHLGSAHLAAEMGVLSMDHLEQLYPEEAEILASAQIVAILLPNAWYFLREDQYPPINALRKAGVKIALGTDLNPGSAPINSLRFAMHLASTLWRMSPEEILLGVTRFAADALGWPRRGRLEPNAVADVLLYPCQDWRALVYEWQLSDCKPIPLEALVQPYAQTD